MPYMTYFPPSNCTHDYVFHLMASTRWVESANSRKKWGRGKDLEAGLPYRKRAPNPK